MMRTHTVTGSPIGDLTLVNTDDVLSGLWMGRRARRWSASELGERSASGFEQVVEELSGYFAGERRTFTVRTAAQGNPFQRRVWALLLRIPFGETRSYGQIARELGDPTLARAVGAAVGANPIGIVVPCHRVIGSDGSLTGYAAGLERKRFLLELESKVTTPVATLF